MMPRRWLYVAFVTVVVAGLGLFAVVIVAAPSSTVGFLSRLRATDSAAVAVGMTIAVASGFLLGVLLVSIYARFDQRLAIVRERMPRAVVLQARKDLGTQEFLRWALDAPQLKLPMQFTLSIDHEGVAVWTGTKAPVLEGVLDWKKLAELGIAYLPKSRFGEPYPGLLFVVTGTYETRAQVIGIEARPKNIQMATIGGEAEVVAAQAEIRAVLGQAVVAAPRTMESLTPKLLPGLSAHVARKRAFLPFAGTIAVGSSLISGGLAAFFSGGLEPGIQFLVLGLVVIAVVSIMHGIVSRAEAHERAEGYTTLNDRNLDLDQRHPRTGVVIRPAFAAALTKAEFADALRRGIR